MAYSEKILNEFMNPANVGVVKGASAVGKVVDNETGEIMKVYLLIGEDGTVTEATFQCFGCAASIAAGSVATKMMLGKEVSEIEKTVTAKAIAGALDAEKNKMRFIESAEKAVKAAIKNYNKKNKV